MSPIHFWSLLRLSHNTEHKEDFSDNFAYTNCHQCTQLYSCYDFSFVPDSFLFSLLKDVVSWLSSIAPVITRHRPMRDHGLSAPAHPSQLVCDEDLIIWRVWRVTRVVMWSVTGGVWRCHVSLSSEGVMAALSEIHGYGLCNNLDNLMASLALSLWRCDMWQWASCVAWSGHNMVTGVKNMTTNSHRGFDKWLRKQKTESCGDWWRGWCVQCSGEVSRDITET